MSESKNKQVLDAIYFRSLSTSNPFYSANTIELNLHFLKRQHNVEVLFTYSSFPYKIND